jgi:hypothetical protein
MKTRNFQWNNKLYQLMWSHDPLTNKISYIFSSIYYVSHREHGKIEAAESITNGIIDKTHYDTTASIIDHLIKKNYLQEPQDIL